MLAGSQARRMMGVVDRTRSSESDDGRWTWGFLVFVSIRKPQAIYGVTTTACSTSSHRSRLLREGANVKGGLGWDERMINSGELRRQAVSAVPLSPPSASQLAGKRCPSSTQSQLRPQKHLQSLLQCPRAKLC